METITLANFLAYFGAYYPLLIPCIALLLLVSSTMLDQLRVWVITYVDEGESGPYKTYVVPLLYKLYGIGNTEVYPPFDREYTSVSTKGNEHTYNHTLPVGGKVLSSNYNSHIRKAKEYLEEHGEEALLSHYLKERGPVLCTAICLAILSLALTAYKFLPAITVGSIVAYAVMRLARSIVRLTKRFNKHVGDGHGPKEEVKGG